MIAESNLLDEWRNRFANRCADAIPNVGRAIARRGRLQRNVIEELSGGKWRLIFFIATTRAAASIPFNGGQ
jgi:hypothetical protein